jgi:hypothetical protein
MRGGDSLISMQVSSIIDEAVFVDSRFGAFLASRQRRVFMGAGCFGRMRSVFAAPVVGARDGFGEKGRKVRACGLFRTGCIGALLHVIKRCGVDGARG